SACLWACSPSTPSGGDVRGRPPRRCPRPGLTLAGPALEYTRPVTLTRDEVRHVAMLARLGLEPGEEDFYADQLSAILAHIDRLREVDTDRIAPTAQVVPLENRMREDRVEPGLTQEQALADAPEARDGYFV